MVKITPQQRIRAELMQLGYSVAKWAEVNGFSLETVYKAIQRWPEKTGIPRGETYVILTRLEETLGRPIYTKID